jgi:hypothetical protein
MTQQMPQCDLSRLGRQDRAAGTFEESRHGDEKTWVVIDE